MANIQSVISLEPTSNPLKFKVKWNGIIIASFNKWAEGTLIVNRKKIFGMKSEKIEESFGIHSDLFFQSVFKFNFIEVHYKNQIYTTNKEKFLQNGFKYTHQDCDKIYLSLTDFDEEGNYDLFESEGKGE